MSMTRFLYDRADPRDVVFLYSARHESDLIFRDELAFMTARSRTLRAAVTLTGGAVSWRGLQGRISPALLDDAVPDFRERSVFLCGPNRFMETAREALQASGFPMSNFHAESFGGARAESVSHPGVTEEPTPARESSPPSSRLRVSQLLSILPRPRLAAPVDAEDTAACASVPVTPSVRGSVLFRTSGREANDCANQTILELAESLGLALPSACRSGVCGTCKTRKVEGSVSMDCEDGLDASDRSDGFILACTARALDRVVVEA
jgi:ferredoxin